MLDGVAGSVLSSGLFGGEEVGDGTEGLVFAVDGDDAGEALTRLIIRICGLGGVGCALEF